MKTKAKDKRGALMALKKKKLLDTIQERWLRAPKATFVYSVKR